MAVEHVVLMKLGDPVPEQKLRALYRDCEAHLEKVPGVESVSMGANFHPSSSGFTHALLVRLRDKNAFTRYLPHPDHVAAGALLKGVFADFLVVDYETERE